MVPSPSGLIPPDPAAAPSKASGPELPSSGLPPERFLWRHLRRAAGKPGRGWYPNLNQANRGLCVPIAWKHAIDVLHGVQIDQNGQKKVKWKPCSAEAIYALGRIEVGKSPLMEIDGIQMEWASRVVRDWGLLPMERLSAGGTAVDLSEFSVERAVAWGRGGLPDAFEPLAKRVRCQFQMVHSWTEAKQRLNWGHPVVVHISEGFSPQRDRDGFGSRADGGPNPHHAMALLGYRTGHRPGGFFLNSYGDMDWPGVYPPADMPRGGFWMDEEFIDANLRRFPNSYALYDSTGFEK